LTRHWQSPCSLKDATLPRGVRTLLGNSSATQCLLRMPFPTHLTRTSVQSSYGTFF
jgi:hypothetical protein